MARVVDSCLLIDIAESDPTFGTASADFLDASRSFGLVICPVTYIEIAPVFGGDTAQQDLFLQELGVNFSEAWLSHDTSAAHQAWDRYAKRKRKGEVLKRPIADILIGAFACRFECLMTRNAQHFQTHFPTLKILEPDPTPADKPEAGIDQASE